MSATLDRLTRVITLSQAERDMLIQLAKDHQIYLLGRLETHDATAIAGVFADVEAKYAGHRRTIPTGHFHIQWQQSERALEGGSAVVHQWYAIDPGTGDESALSGYFYKMDQAQTLYAKDIWCNGSHLALMRQNLDEDRKPQIAEAMSGKSPPGDARRLPGGGDALTEMIWTICYGIKESGREPKQLGVMAELKKLAGSMDAAKKRPLVGDTAGGVKYENSNGDETELTSTRLQARINEWRKAQA